MPEKARSIERHAFNPSDKLLLDANIWLFIYSPQYRPTDRQTKIYSAALKRMLDAGCTIFLDALVLSEFVNVLGRLAYNRLPVSQRPSDFKSFRNSSAFKATAKRIADSCKRIFQVVTRIESGLVSCDPVDVLHQYEAGRSDINDLLLAHLCRTHALIFVTDDSDFRMSGLSILTANSRLLR